MSSETRSAIKQKNFELQYRHKNLGTISGANKNHAAGKALQLICKSEPNVSGWIVFTLSSSDARKSESVKFRGRRIPVPGNPQIRNGKENVHIKFRYVCEVVPYSQERK